MKTVLHIDSSARPGGSEVATYGSHTRRLSGRFMRKWRERRQDDRVLCRDVGLNPPTPVSAQWIHAAFTPPTDRTLWMEAVLHESDMLVDELISADIIVAGVPMYNFSVPAQFKAYIDNVVRVGRTFGFDRARSGEPYWPLLSEMNKKLIILSSRGDFGYDPSGRVADQNHVEASIRTAFAYIGITDVQSIAIEYDEFADERLTQSIQAAENAVDALVAGLTTQSEMRINADALV
ncbi:FMN-dependent NADH-azoreductase [Chelativorans sp. YIM 93263]|uniref:FMN-dependent NADH-azoreductase n=1 Tax=Chelativorans sp. YIM 93263 TaxID=2906648 RepID=UPI0023790585|nr:NAD(P)H-dependent oxidoreductase [Chelativorans sp. YIM 93263]